MKKGELFVYYWGLSMTLVVLYTYIMALMNDGIVSISVIEYNEAIWEFPIVLIGSSYFVYRLVIYLVGR